MLRGIRGAITVEKNEKIIVNEAVEELLEKIINENEIKTEDIGAAIFSATADIDVTFPAAAARKLAGWDMVPLFDAQQMAVDNSIERCIRVLLLVDTDKKQNEIQHIYLRRAQNLRPDISKI